jgi:chromosome segregation ATPase
MGEGARRKGPVTVSAGPDRIAELEEECRELSARLAQLQRELHFAQADIEVKAEYIATFESEITTLEDRLEEALGHLRTKTAYIESLPSVRLKAWVGGLLARSR